MDGMEIEPPFLGLERWEGGKGGGEREGRS